MSTELGFSFSGNDALDLFARHRAALRTEKPAQRTPPRDESEAEMIAMLGLLAQAVAARAPQTASAPDAGDPADDSELPDDPTV